jgi:methyl-accepting chemotaxis protein
VEDITKVADLVNGISIASNEQAVGISQINQGIMQVSQVTQTNSAPSEESAAASEELSSQAEVLKEMVNKFKLKKGNISSYNDFNYFKQDGLKMNGQISEKDRGKNEFMPIKTTISLTDNEFGKF